MATLPARSDGQPHPGLAGHYAGSQGERLILAGGTLYDAKRSPLEAAKEYATEILVLEMKRAETGAKTLWLPAVSTTVPNRTFSIGVVKIICVAPT